MPLNLKPSGNGLSRGEQGLGGVGSSEEGRHEGEEGRHEGEEGRREGEGAPQA